MVPFQFTGGGGRGESPFRLYCTHEITQGFLAASPRRLSRSLALALYLQSFYKQHTLSVLGPIVHGETTSHCSSLVHTPTQRVIMDIPHSWFT